MVSQSNMRKASDIARMTLLVWLAAAGQNMASDMTGRLQAAGDQLRLLANEPASRADAYFGAVAPLGFAELADYEADLVSQPPEPGKSRPVAKLLPVAMLLDAALGKASAETLQSIADAQGADGAAIYFEDGPVFLRDIQAALAGVPGSVQAELDGAHFILSRPLVLSSRALLVLLPGEELTMDRATGAFIIAAGGMIIDRATISGSEAENETERKFRPFVLADATTGPVELSGVQVARLGFGNDPRSAGLTITGGARGDERRSFVQDSIFTDTGTLTLVDAAQSTIRRNVFHKSASTALSIASSASVIVDGNAIIEPLKGHGVKLGPNSANVLLSDNIVANSERHGLLVEGDARGSLIFNNLLLLNHASGVAVLSGSCLLLEQNVTLANADDGIMVRNSTNLSFQTNMISANQRAGLSVGGTSGSLRLDDNRFENNKVGLRASANFDLALNNNDWTGQTPRLLDGDAANYTLSLLEAIKSGNTQLTMAGTPLPSTTSQATPACELGGAV
jgi:poly(beta-D-mannuronate) C5 epimerase